MPTVSTSLGNTFRPSYLDFLSPFLETAQAIRLGVVDFCVGIVRGPILLSENRVLREQIATLIAHEEVHEQLQQENIRLQQLLDFQKKSSWRTTSAQVIGTHRSAWSRGIVLNKGDQHGIRVGQAVVTPAGLVGRVVEVGSLSSRAILLTDPHFRVSAVLSKARTSGLLTGTSSGQCHLTYLPVESNLVSGELVETAGGMSFCPDGIPVGVIEEAVVDQSLLYRTARIRPSVSLYALDEVLVVAWSGLESGN